MGRNFGEQKNKKRRGQSKKAKTKNTEKSPYKSNQKNVPQETVTCREMVLYVPPNVQQQQQQKSNSSRAVQVQRRSVPFGFRYLSTLYQDRNCHESSSLVNIDDDDDDEWEDIDDDDDDDDDDEGDLGYFLRQIMFDHMFFQMFILLNVALKRR